MKIYNHIEILHNMGFQTLPWIYVSLNHHVLISLIFFKNKNAVYIAS